MEKKVIFAPKTVKIKGGEILVRLLREEDGPQLALEEQAQGWGTTTEKFETRSAILQRARASRCVRNSMASRWGM